MDLSLLTTHTALAFLLMMFRLAGMMVSAPIFNIRSVPSQAKIGLVFATALVLFPLHAANFTAPTNLIQFAVMAIQETAIGLLIGFAASLVFFALQMAGEFIGFQMGISVAQVLDPVNGTNVPVIGQLFFYFGALLFLSLNVHHALILAVEHSFDLIPLGGLIANFGALTERFLHLTGQMFILAMMVGLPIMGILLVLEVALSFVAKVMPQMNIFMVGIPLKVAVGLLVLITTMPALSVFLGDQYAELIHTLMGLYKV